MLNGENHDFILYIIRRPALMCLRRCLFLFFAGILSYPSPYPAMIHPLFLPRPPGAFSVVPAVPRPLVPGIPGVCPVISQIIRPVVPSVTPAEKPQTTVYVGKIAPSVENDFMSSLLQVCYHLHYLCFTIRLPLALPIALFMSNYQSFHSDKIYGFSLSEVVWSCQELETPSRSC